LCRFLAFQREGRKDARSYLRDLPERLEKFGLRIVEEKSLLVKFNRRWEHWKLPAPRVIEVSSY